MPIYEYACRVCGHEFDELQSFSDKPLKRCPKCGKDGLEKLVSAPGIQFKGSGWYLTDYSQKGKPKEEATSGSSTTKPEKTEKKEKAKPKSEKKDNHEK